MLLINHSNKLEVLFQDLHTIIRIPLNADVTNLDPFEPVTIVVPHPGMGRWLAQQLALTSGIAANFSFQLQEKFFWQILRAWERHLPERPPWNRDALTWSIMQSLPKFATNANFTEINCYLNKEPTDLRLFQLAERIAVVFERYLLFRADWLLAWEQGQDHHWQAQLWRILIKHEKFKTHWGKVLYNWNITHATTPVKTLPAQIIFFGIDSLAPVYKEFIEILSNYININIFYLNPARRTWFKNNNNQSGNPLLINFGHTKQIVLQQLAELTAKQHSTFVNPSHDTLLHRLQSNILEIQDNYHNSAINQYPPFKVTDTSIQIHSCHSPMREVQVLRDNLLKLFTTLPDLKPREVLVAAPDMDNYAPYVEAVFGAMDNEIVGTTYRIPWSVTNRTLDATAQSLCIAIETLLKLPNSRFNVSEILSLLRIPAIQKRLKLNTLGLYRIQTLIQESKICWGIDAAHRADLQLPEEEANTWKFGLNKLSSIHNDDTQYIEILHTFFNQLMQWRQRLLDSRSLPEWRDTLQSLCADIFVTDLKEEEELFITLNTELETLIKQANDTHVTNPISIKLFRVLIENLLNNIDKSYPRLVTGKVTFCSLQTMRSIPFRVICLLGMNGVDFPRHQHAPSFDLMMQQPRLGDLSIRQEDNALFLDALLATRDCLYISYIGNDIKDNSIKTPSVIVSDLLDYISKIHKSYLPVNHPLQPFSPRAYDGVDTHLQSYATEWLKAARSQVNTEITAFVNNSLPELDESWRVVNLDDLIQFFINPAHYFLIRRLGITLPKIRSMQEDLEPFVLDNLEIYKLKSALLPLVEDKSDETLLAQTRSEGILPHGNVGTLVFADNIQQVRIFASRLHEYKVPTVEPIVINLKINDFNVHGQLNSVTVNGILSSRIGKLRSKDRLELWIRHLILCAIQPTGITLNSLYITEDAEWRISTVDDPLPILNELLTLYWQGLIMPLPFFPESSLACYEYGLNSREFHKYWDDSNSLKLESEDLAVRIAFRGIDPIDGQFAVIAERIFATMQKYSMLNKLQ